MKKLFTLIMLFGIIGCNSSGVVSEANVKKALDIAYNETKNFNMGYGTSPIEFKVYLIRQYLNEQKYRNNMECTILDMSDVEGKKSTRACLLKGVDIDKEGKEDPKNVLVMAIKNETNKDIVILMFFENAEKTENGYKYSSLMPIGILVNLATQKIGDI